MHNWHHWWWHQFTCCPCFFYVRFCKRHHPHLSSCQKTVTNIRHWKACYFMQFVTISCCLFLLCCDARYICHCRFYKATFKVVLYLTFLAGNLCFSCVPHRRHWSKLGLRKNIRCMLRRTLLGLVLTSLVVAGMLPWVSPSASSLDCATAKNCVKVTTTDFVFYIL